ncbi:MAG TPA: prepilin-type N-terminal cleavage/methylation domain-containing protein [Thermoanaerobaculales bacterium]|nr:prepilin-type N-terminal cleavage/methylation domain-containing protein [Thermoanaerobaculales bacterium]HPA80798.1 prepilin-type N-terminal cleavage/methylation domain-containing protein [Thermoanaerobaculales bacterium]HQL31484.1 prepilin-type N-terminal cleavage/methylation domain-containing protein [Thermoanaerobaculales bacterium]HQP44240.1 prepilin-type N-terminal cleavage/methylation domain-containing protein [Thermoanaerobaculales bacterium]
MRRNASQGFTLVEMVVTIGLLAIVFIGVLNMLDTSQQLSKVEAALSDTQENVRFAAYHITRTIRMTGGGDMPFARDDGTWVCGRIQNNESGSVATDYGNVQVAAGSDVVTLRGFFEVAPFFTNRTDVDASSGTVTVRELRTPAVGADVINPLDAVPNPASLVGRGLLLMGRRQYAVGEVASAAIVDASPDRHLVLTYAGGSAPWPSLNADGAALGSGDPAFEVYRVGILESYTYFVSPDFVLRRVGPTTGAGGEPVAVNIGSLQLALGLDTTGDGIVDTWDPSATAVTVAGSRLMAMQLAVFGRTPFEVSEWREPVETFAGFDLDPGQVNRGAKWRRMQVTASLRNFVL